MQKTSVKILFLASLFLVSCSSDKKNADLKDAVSVLENHNILQADSTIADLKITVPTEQNSDFWFGFSADNNNRIENFSFAKNISDIASIHAGYKSSADYPFVFAPIITGNRIYLLDNQANLYERNLNDYKKIWQTKLVKRKDLRNFIWGKISYQNGVIFVTSGYNLLLAVNAENGQILWKKTIASIPISTLIPDEEQIFAITNDNKTYALNAKNGQINWVHSGILRNTGILGAANPVIYKNYLVASYSSGEIYVLDKNSGNQIWTTDLNRSKAIDSDFILNDIDATPIVKNDIIYSIGNGGLMIASDINNGNILWQKELASISDFWIAGDFIYLINNDDQLLCLHSKDGAIRWLKNLTKYKNPKKPNSKIIYNGVMMAGGNLLLTNSNNEIILISPQNGEILYSRKIHKKITHNPIVVKGRIYLHTIGFFSTKLLVIN